MEVRRWNLEVGVSSSVGVDVDDVETKGFARKDRSLSNGVVNNRRF